MQTSKQQLAATAAAALQPKQQPAVGAAAGKGTTTTAATAAVAAAAGPKTQLLASVAVVFKAAGTAAGTFTASRPLQVGLRVNGSAFKYLFGTNSHPILTSAGRFNQSRDVYGQVFGRFSAASRLLHIG